MSTLPRSSRLLVVLALATVPAGCMCGPGYGSLGDHVSETGGSGDTGTGDSDDGATSDDGGTGGGSSASGTSSATGSESNSTTNPACEPVQLADITQGIGGFAMDGEKGGDDSGGSVSVAGDVNGDGLDDVVVGAYRAEPNGTNSGRTYLVLGKADADRVALADVAQGIGGFALDGEPSDHSGKSVSAAGDVNGDGLGDFIVGAHGAEWGTGRAYVVFGTTDTAPSSLADVAAGIGGFALDGEDTQDQAGYSVSGAGDVNGDGLSDLLVGAPEADANVSALSSGRSYVVFGRADTGRVSLADVAQGIGGFALDGEAEEDRSGSSVSGAGDLNGDGLADVIVGAPTAAPNGSYSGRIYVVFGKADTVMVSFADVAAGVGGFVMDGEAWHDSAGTAVSGAGDVNGDGVVDVIVGAPGADPNGIEMAGRAYVVFGKADTEAIPLADVVQGIGGFAMDGGAEMEAAGMSVSGAGDMNGDGLADIVVGTGWSSPNGESSGRAYVVFGEANTDLVSLTDVAHGLGGFAMDGEAVDDQAGASVSGGGDVNGDGIPDVIVGAACADPNGDNAGRTYVVFGGDFSCGGG